MPVIKVELYAGRTSEQKLACARDIIEAVRKNLGAPPEATQVIFVDIEKSDWLVGNRIPPAS